MSCDMAEETPQAANGDGNSRQPLAMNHLNDHKFIFKYELAPKHILGLKM